MHEISVISAGRCGSLSSMALVAVVETRKRKRKAPPANHTLSEKRGRKRIQSISKRIWENKGNERLSKYVQRGNRRGEDHDLLDWICMMILGHYTAYITGSEEVKRRAGIRCEISNICRDMAKAEKTVQDVKGWEAWQSTRIPGSRGQPLNCFTKNGLACR